MRIPKLSAEKLMEIAYLRKSTNKYGYRGLEIKGGRYIAACTVNKVKICTGAFDTPEEAAWAAHTDPRFVKPTIYPVSFPDTIPAHMDKERLLSNFSNTRCCGFMGVMKSTSSRMYEAYYKLDGKRQYIGYYPTALDAGWAYIEHSKSVGHVANLKAVHDRVDPRKEKPPIELDKIAYLKDDRVVTGYRYCHHVKGYYWSTFRKHSTLRYDSPEAATWALYCELGKVEITAIRHLGETDDRFISKKIANRYRIEAIALSESL